MNAHTDSAYFFTNSFYTCVVAAPIPPDTVVTNTSGADTYTEWLG